MERRVWMRGVWEMMKEAFCQKIMTYHLPSPPLLLPNQFSGRTVIVTGATSGIGLHTARELAMAGAHVIMACRNVKAANELARVWEHESRVSGESARVEVMGLDLMSLSSVRCFAGEWERRGDPLHVLINNAGILHMGEPQRFSEDGIERHMQVNHVAPALLTALLVPSLLRVPTSRIINVNSVAHHCAVVDPKRWMGKTKGDDDFSGLRAYGESKLANLMFLKALASKLSYRRKTSIQCIAVNPGIVNTKLVQRPVPIPQWRLFWMFHPSQGARSVLFCATHQGVVDDLVDSFAYYTCNCKPAPTSAQVTDQEACLDVFRSTLEVLNTGTNKNLTQLLDDYCDHAEHKANT
ncbi:hypothetical protein QJS10_CPB11g01854 [Acorus calamus]|uniref:Ketoreductase domain-containing protein n=1 Tax=Acorus calamus TaxID=4465 RepID=A0AAV9DUH7_ACOCL|nr:hypothetical protein QJS10_CPB11g01854 [Acorus calamus]